MHRRILFAATIAVLVIGMAAPGFMPKANASYQSANLQTSGLVTRGYTDLYLNTVVDAVKAGSTFTFTLTLVANTNQVQRNISMGVKFDWMNQFQNATNANPSSTYSLLANQYATLTVSVTIPQLTGQYANFNLTPHYWTLEVWSTPANQPTWTAGCPTFAQPPNDPNVDCLMFSNNGNGYNNCYWYNYCTVIGHTVAIYNDQQAGSVSTFQQASAEITVLGNYLNGLKQAPPGTSSAVASLAAAETQLGLGEEAYRNGDFATAQTDYQNALNDANAAQSSLSTTGGGTDVATMTSIWLGGAAIIMGGIGALLLGFGGFKYMRGKTRSLPSYTPPTPAKS